MGADVTGLAFDSKVSIFKLGAGAVDISADITNIEFPSAWKELDITTYGKEGMTYYPGIWDTKFTIDFIWNQLTTTGTQQVVGAMHYAKAAAATAFEYYPAGATSGNLKVSGNCRCPSYRFMGRVGDCVRVRAEFDVDGAIVFTGPTP